MPPIIKENLVIALNALAAMVIYGAWAIYANYEHGQNAWATAGAVQGVYAFFSTLSVTAAAKWMYAKCRHGTIGIACGFCFSFIIMVSIPASIHTIVGTPDILQTILPGLIWGAGYLLIFLILIEQKRNK